MSLLPVLVVLWIIIDEICVFLLTFSFSSNSFNSWFHFFLLIVSFPYESFELSLTRHVWLFLLIFFYSLPNLLILEMIINFNFNFIVFLSSRLNDHWWPVPFYSELPSFCNAFIDHKWVFFAFVKILDAFCFAFLCDIFNAVFYYNFIFDSFLWFFFLLRYFVMSCFNIAWTVPI